MHADIYKKSSAGCILQVQTVDSHLISELYGEEGEVTFDKRSGTCFRKRRYNRNDHSNCRR